MENNTIDSLLEWLKVQPRTLGWDAICVYDREKSNRVLLQEYIGRFSTDDYMKPVTLIVEDNQTPTYKEWIANYIFDRPRISFVDSDLMSATAELRKKVVGGSRLTYDQQPGSIPKLIKVALEDALGGPECVMEIDLTHSDGEVTPEGSVVLNLKTARNYRLTHSDSEPLSKLAGRRLQEHFAGLPDKQMTFVLSEMKYEAGQVLKPKHFMIRTQAAPGASVRGALNEGAGAVIMLITLEGGTDGVPPASSKDLRYLIPDGHSATILLAHKVMLNTVLVEGARRINNVPIPFTYELKPGTTPGFYFSKTLSGGAVHYPNATISRPGYTFELKSLFLPMGKNALPPLPPGDEDGWLSLSLKAERIVFLWYGKLSQEFTVGSRDGTIDSEFAMIASGDYVLDQDTGTLKLEYEIDGTVTKSEVKPGSFQNLPEVVNDFSYISDYFHSQFEGMYGNSLAQFVSSTFEINVFTLNSLLFRGDNAVTLKSAHFPLDLALFGEVGPTQTRFSVSPLESVIAHSKVFEFKTDPPQNNLTWTVENIAGATGDVGVIDAQGKYTPPTAAQIKGSSIRVKVTAKAGVHTSLALITVMARDITINPLVQVVGAGDSNGREVSAGSLEGGQLQWSIANPGSGATVRKSTEKDGDHTYFPGPAIPDTAFSLDEIVVKKGTSTQSSFVLVVHRPAVLTVMIDEERTALLPPNQLQLAIAGKGNVPVAPGALDLTWELKKGAGELDPKTGILKVDFAGKHLHPYALVTVMLPSPVPDVLPDSDGHLILPIPLFTIPETIQMLSPDSH
ncbi:hypothetical protein [Pseudomonas fluorescens]|uniref:Uncharacterized protein n=1 Tax=Pseudomonas fluorescens TaxID=294 RepID=A0A5E7FUA1_PSEFL|nr:hypothetical protein [Pseudomonas fluorescens]VVO42909.1 hypothetical protein PS723_06085 [Pseudomonas fluorescens]